MGRLHRQNWVFLLRTARAQAIKKDPAFQIGGVNAGLMGNCWWPNSDNENVRAKRACWFQAGNRMAIIIDGYIYIYSHDGSFNWLRVCTKLSKITFFFIQLRQAWIFQCMFEKVTRSLRTFKSKWNIYETFLFLITRSFISYFIIFLKVFCTEKNAKYLSILIFGMEQVFDHFSRN